MSRDLIVTRLSGALALLAQAKDAVDAKRVVDLAKAAKVYAERQKLGRDAVAYAHEIAIDALTLLGEFLKANPPRGAGPGRGHKNGRKTNARGELVLGLPPEVTPKESSTAQALATIRAEDPALHEEVRGGKVTPTEAAYRHRENKRKAAAEAGRAARAAAGAALHVEGFHLGDFREVAKQIPDGSVDLIWADPPYDRASLSLYGDLARIAAAKLVPGGSLVCYVGTYLVPDVLDLVRPLLRYWWTLYVLHTGQKARMTEYGIRVTVKQLLWFVRGSRGDKETFLDDSVLSTMEKADHDWQQSLEESRYYVGKLVPRNGLVFDPFLGSGTTALACKQLGVRFVGCDVDQQALNLAKARCA
jgi:hypothetical protein